MSAGPLNAAQLLSTGHRSINRCPATFNRPLDSSMSAGHLNATPLPFNWPKADQPSVGLFNAAGISTVHRIPQRNSVTLQRSSAAFNAAGISTAAPLLSTVAPRQINALRATCKRHRPIHFLQLFVVGGVPLAFNASTY